MTISLPSSLRNRRAIAGAVAALAVGGVAAGCGSTAATTSTGAAVATASPAGTPPAGARGGGPGMGSEVTGTVAAKAKAAALAKYPGTVERVRQLDDGSYVVHVIQSSGGEVHVAVSKAFAVTGTEQGGPGGAGAPPTSTSSS